MLQQTPHWLGNAEGFRPFHRKAAGTGELEQIAVAGDAVVQSERRNGQTDNRKLLRLLKFMQKDGIGQLGHNNAEPLHNAPESGAAIDMKRIGTPGFAQAQQKARQAAAMIAVIVGQQQTVDAAKAPAKATDGGLCVLAAID